MKIALIQLCSHLEPKANLIKIEKFTEEAKTQKAEVIFLPECFLSISNGKEATPYPLTFESEELKSLAALAKKHSLYFVGGSVAFKSNGAIVNRTININPKGEFLPYYDKNNLFKCDLSDDPSKKVVNEEAFFKAGSHQQMIEVNGWNIGLSICFDLRFPELFRKYFKDGAHLMSISSAFTVPTGLAHWHVLVRARAIENQSYVVACGQWGEHHPQVSTFGHSLVVDPWGEVVMDLGTAEGVGVIDIDMEKVKAVRKRMLVI